MSNYDGNRKKLRISLHWLTATSREVSSIDAVAFISEYLEHGPEVRDSGQWGYTSAFVWAGGLKLLDNAARPEMGVCLIADGASCEFYGFSKLSYIYQALQLNATRCDLAADGCRFSPKQLRDHWYRDNVRTVCKPMTGAQALRKDIRTCEWMSSPTGDTFYMGSRSSTQFARCYNSRGFTRFEMELKKERASQIMEALNTVGDMAAILGSAINQFVAFIKHDDSNRARCSYQPFWRRFLGDLSDADVITRLDARPEPTIDRLKDWIENQVAPSLYVYETVFGKRDDFSDVRHNLRRLGLDRCKPKHGALIQAGGGWIGTSQGGGPWSSLGG